MITAEDRVIAGVSGGADSVCLFFVLLELSREMGFEFSAVVHVNHGLRGESSDSDEQFVSELCGKYHIPLEIFNVDLESIAKKRKQSLEEAGRIVRREAFEATRKKYGADKIALAHHQNDNAETLLWNLCRGAGPKGMGGIRPVNGVFIRPLLCMSRKEIEEFLLARNQGYCNDETNDETVYTRNKMRHLVIPVLEEQVNARAVQHINEAACRMWEVEEYMEDRTREAYEACAECGEGICLIFKERLEAFPPVIRKRVVRKSLEEVSGQLKDLGQVHVESVAELLKKQPGRSLNLPYGIKAKRVYEGVRLERCGRAETEVLQNGQEISGIQLQIPGDTHVPEANIIIRCTVFPKKDGISEKDIPQKGYTKWFDYDIITKSAICIRTRKAGDTIAIDKDGHRKKIKSWFVNEKIPAEERDKILMIAEEDRILWILGYRMGSDYQISGNTRQILQIKVMEENENDRDN